MIQASAMLNQCILNVAIDSNSNFHPKKHVVISLGICGHWKMAPLCKHSPALLAEWEFWLWLLLPRCVSSNIWQGSSHICPLTFSANKPDTCDTDTWCPVWVENRSLMEEERRGEEDAVVLLPCTFKMEMLRVQELSSSKNTKWEGAEIWPWPQTVKGVQHRVQKGVVTLVQFSGQRLDGG